MVSNRNEKPITFYPIGYVKNIFTDSKGLKQVKTNESEIILDPNLAPGLTGLAEGKKIMVLFHFHRASTFDLFQHPRGDSNQQKRGVFSLRSPNRPNPIGVTVVEILEIKKNILKVRDLDAFNGTPVIDLKPA